MKKIIIRSHEDLDAALPQLVPYAPSLGSLLLIDSQAQPVAALYPDLIAFHTVESLAPQLEIFKGRDVIVYGIGWSAPTEFGEALMKAVGSNVLHFRTLDATEVAKIFAGMRDRDGFLAGGGAADLLEAEERAARIVAGNESR